MNPSTRSGRNFRLLTIALQTCQPPVDWARLAAQPGLDWVGDAADCDDGLRQALMTYPDAIVLPWTGLTMKLVRAFAGLRGECFAPLVVAIMPEGPCEDFAPCDGAAVLKVEQLYQDGLAAVLQSLLAVRQPNKNGNHENGNLKGVIAQS
ncbi:MAG: hypothetical protein P9F19_05760 [Candidatus Contendobacter sp.]|nr:hypothetical protein [Candidatus Contendobacter sp.]MDG4556882.1 hypothetical protein [Candidatus Contendobacter sp.]